MPSVSRGPLAYSIGGGQPDNTSTPITQGRPSEPLPLPNQPQQELASQALKFPTSDPRLSCRAAMPFVLHNKTSKTQLNPSGPRSGYNFHKTYLGTQPRDIPVPPAPPVCLSDGALSRREGTGTCPLDGQGHLGSSINLPHVRVCPNLAGTTGRYMLGQVFPWISGSTSKSVLQQSSVDLCDYLQQPGAKPDIPFPVWEIRGLDAVPRVLRTTHQPPPLLDNREAGPG